MVRRNLSALWLALVLSGLPAHAQPDAAGAVKAFYKAMAARDYPTAWDLLTADSQRGIVGAAARRSGFPETELSALFVNNSDQVRPFWDSLRKNSRADVLAKLPFRVVEKGQHEARVRYHPPGGGVVHVRCFRQGGHWKLGFLETFFPEGELR